MGLQFRLGQCVLHVATLHPSSNVQESQNEGSDFIRIVNVESNQMMWYRAFHFGFGGDRNDVLVLWEDDCLAMRRAMYFQLGNRYRLESCAASMSANLLVG